MSRAAGDIYIWGARSYVGEKQINTKRAAGFTLIELMITVAIAGIFAAMAYPSYQNYLLKNRRGAAQTFLLQVAQRQQRYFLDNHSFATDLTTLDVTTPLEVSPYYGTPVIATTAGPPPMLPGNHP